MPSVSKNAGGLYQYSLNLLNAIAKEITGSKFNIYVLVNYENESIRDSIEKFSNLYQIPSKYCKEPFEFRLWRYSSYILQKILSKLKINIQLKLISEIEFVIRKFNIDILHSPLQEIPRHLGIPAIVTMHDLQELHFPEFFSPFERMKRAMGNMHVIAEASAVIVSFNHVKEDIVKYFGKEKEKIFVLSPDMKLWCEEIKDEEIISLDHLNISHPFILYPAATWEHKNHLKLILAIHHLKKKNIEINLVCTGNKTAYYFEHIQNAVKQSGLNHRIKFLGIISELELFSLYQKCKAVVIPSLYEAGSYPLYESIVLGIPVICSNVTSLPETIGCEKFIFNPVSVEEIADKIYGICYDKQYRIDNINNSKIVAKRLMSNNVAKKFVTLYVGLKANTSIKQNDFSTPATEH